MVLDYGSLRRIRREMDILSLCLSKEKEPKRNDTREGKIAISSPPETHPNSNAQEGRSPLGSPPRSYGFARGFCISQVPPPGGDEPRPCTADRRFPVGADALGGPRGPGFAGRCVECGDGGILLLCLSQENRAWEGKIASFPMKQKAPGRKARCFLYPENHRLGLWFKRA